MLPMNERQRLCTKEFIVLSGLFFVACATAAAFFNFHEYLTTLPIDPGWFGFILGADALAGLVAQPFISPFLNHRNSGFYIVAGTLGLALALLAYGLAVTTAQVVLVRLLHGFFFVLSISAITAAVVAFIPTGRSGQAFGIISMIRLVPYALLPPFLDTVTRDSSSFIGVLRYVSLVLVASLALLFVPAGGRLSFKGQAGRGSSIKMQELAANLREKNVLVLFLITILLSGGYAMTFFYLKGFGASVGLSNPGLFFTVATATMILVRFLGAPFFDKVNKKVISIGTLLFMGVSYGLIPLSARIGLALPGCLIGLAWGIAFPLLGALLFDLSPPEYRAVNTNFSMVMVQAGFFAGPLMGNAMIGLYGYNAMFFSCAALSFIAAVLSGTVRLRNQGALS
jgi:predicted MFS family arabinose efflux permease